MSVPVAAIRSHLTEVMSVDKIQPALVIVDYPDKLKPSLPKEDRWTNEAYNIDELISIAKEFDLSVWWAWHPTKQASAAKARGKGEVAQEVLTMADGKGSFEKCHGVDGVFTLNRNETDIGANRARLWVDKWRRVALPSTTLPMMPVFYQGTIVELSFGQSRYQDVRAGDGYV